MRSMANETYLQPNRPKKRWKKRLLGLVLLAVIGGLGYLLYQRSLGSGIQPTPEQAQSAKVTLTAAGDMIPHETVNAAAKSGEAYNYLPLFEQVKPLFDKADIRFCNQEAPSAGAGLGISGFPTFNAPLEFPRDLQRLGCNLINLANNHMGDKGTEGIGKTLDTWDKLGGVYAVSGANRTAQEQSTVKYFEREGIKFAFVAFTEQSNNPDTPAFALNRFDPSLITKLVNDADLGADFVIVSAHWGTEASADITPAQQQQAKLLADAGADLVIGTGPHVLQPVQKVASAKGKDTVVWYSIGNFLSSQLTIEELIGGIAVMEVEKTDKATLKSLRFLPTYMHYEWNPAEKAAEDLLKRKNLKIYPLDQAAEPLGKSLHGTTVEAQTQRVKDILNKQTMVEVITSTSY